MTYLLIENGSNNINCGQNCVLNPALDSVNYITIFPVNPFIETSIQDFNKHRVLISC